MYFLNLDINCEQKDQEAHKFCHSSFKPNLKERYHQNSSPESWSFQKELKKRTSSDVTMLRK